MTRLALIASALAATLLTTPVLAQSAATTPAKPPVATAPVKPTTTAPAPAPAPVAPAPAAATQKVNLNTATAAELDALPQIGPARSKAILEARTKGKFKSWDDFVARGVIPSNAEAAIKDLVVVK